MKTYNYAQCVGAAMRFYRETRGLSIQETADRVSLSAESVSRMEHGIGSQSQTVQRLFAWSVALSVDLPRLFWLANLLRWNLPRLAGASRVDCGGEGLMSIDELGEYAAQLAREHGRHGP